MQTTTRANPSHFYISQKIDSTPPLLSTIKQTMSYLLQQFSAKFVHADKYLQLCNEHDIDKTLFMQATLQPTENSCKSTFDFITIYPQILLQPNTTDNKCQEFFQKMKCNPELTTFFVTCRDVLTTIYRYNQVKPKKRHKIDKRDLIEFICYTNYKTFNRGNLENILKKYGLAKCLIFTRYDWSIDPIELTTSFFKMCEKEPIYYCIYKTLYFNELICKIIAIHDELKIKIKKRVQFRNGCKMVMPICDDLQTEMMTETVNQLLANDYVLLHVIRYL